VFEIPGEQNFPTGENDQLIALVKAYLGVTAWLLFVARSHWNQGTFVTIVLSSWHTPMNSGVAHL